MTSTPPPPCPTSSFAPVTAWHLRRGSQAVALPLRARANARRATRAACARAVQTHTCAYLRVWQACRRFNEHLPLSRPWRTRPLLVAAVVHFDHPKSGRSAKRAASSSHRIYWYRPSEDLMHKVESSTTVHAMHSCACWPPMCGPRELSAHVCRCASVYSISVHRPALSRVL
jgi:hypothetical protein